MEIGPIPILPACIRYQECADAITDDSLSLIVLPEICFDPLLFSSSMLVYDTHRFVALTFFTEETRFYQMIPIMLQLEESELTSAQQACNFYRDVQITLVCCTNVDDPKTFPNMLLTHPINCHVNTSWYHVIFGSICVDDKQWFAYGS